MNILPILEQRMCAVESRGLYSRVMDLWLTRAVDN